MALNMTWKTYRCSNGVVVVYDPKAPGIAYMPSAPFTMGTRSAPPAEVKFEGGNGGYHFSFVGNVCYNAGVEFLRVKSWGVNGTYPTHRNPRTFSLLADQVDGDWSPALQLGLFKLIKDVVASAINFKADMYQLFFAARDSRLNKAHWAATLLRGASLSASASATLATASSSGVTQSPAPSAARARSADVSSSATATAASPGSPNAMPAAAGLSSPRRLISCRRFYALGGDLGRWFRFRPRRGDPRWRPDRVGDR